MSEDMKTIPMDVRHGPERVWEPTGEAPDGRTLWGSREWRSGERSEYERTVLRKPRREA
jgi:hypothetical protein